VTTLLARVAIAYALACVGYLLLTRHHGTPLQDSLTPEQRALQRASAARRGRAFALALIAGSTVAARVPM
tara:strand:+ start:456 stop:665 length:210 start_codon:yes stop_codon:yes gene_type:complete